MPIDHTKSTSSDVMKPLTSTNVKKPPTSNCADLDESVKAVYQTILLEMEDKDKFKLKLGRFVEDVMYNAWIGFSQDHQFFSKFQSKTTLEELKNVLFGTAHPELFETKDTEYWMCQVFHIFMLNVFHMFRGEKGATDVYQAKKGTEARDIAAIEAGEKWEEHLVDNDQEQHMPRQQSTPPAEKKGQAVLWVLRMKAYISQADPTVIQRQTQNLLTRKETTFTVVPAKKSESPWLPEVQRDPLATAQTGTEAEIIEYLHLDKRELKTTHEKMHSTTAKVKGPATDNPVTFSAADPSSASSSRLKTKPKAWSAEEVDSENSADKLDVKPGTNPPSKKHILSQVVKYHGKPYTVQKELADLLLSKKKLMEVTFREEDGIIVIED
ncbi:hypothetical protein BJ741DRAFT_693890 [Chytriomyces cf. hyalinus JEL632]|nr:hypothetical protein BJ741DRAFT_693890 [Chytriomyces cf. hyalinus JEL632]